MITLSNYNVIVYFTMTIHDKTFFKVNFKSFLWSNILFYFIEIIIIHINAGTDTEHNNKIHN